MSTISTKTPSDITAKSTTAIGVSCQNISVTVCNFYFFFIKAMISNTKIGDVAWLSLRQQPTKRH